jgi:uncharacterized phage protein gp47/JayE
MAKFEPKTFPDFVRRMAARIVARTKLNDLEDGGVLLTIIAAFARELEDLHYQMVRMQDIWDIDTATGSDLDSRAADVNPDEISRAPAVNATGKVTFYRASNVGSIVIPEGVQLGVDGGESYTTIDEGFIANGQTSSDEVPVGALAPGDIGNILFLGKLSADLGLPDWDPLYDTGGPTGISKFVTPVAGVDGVKNTSLITGGSDLESDASLRERVKTYLRSLSRATPFALESAVLGASLPLHGRIQVASVVELLPPRLGEVLLYVDDGTGTSAEIQGHNLEFDPVTMAPTGLNPEVVVTSASGGEVRLYTIHRPHVPGGQLVVTWWVGGLMGVDTLLVVGDPYVDAPGTYDVLINRGSGKLTLISNGPSGIPDGTVPGQVEGLQPGDAVTIRYQWYEGLLALAQKIIEGDVDDRKEFPGFRAAGVQVQCLPPLIIQLTLEATIQVDAGFEQQPVIDGCRSAVLGYINALPINGDVIVTEIVAVMQAVSGVHDVIFTTGGSPIILVNTIIGEGELCRIKSVDVIFTGA